MKNFLIKEFLYNGHLQSLGSVGIVLLSYYFFDLGIGVPVALLISTYCLFQPIYYFDRYRDYKKDYLTNKERSSHIEKYVKVIPLLIIVLIVLYIFSTLKSGNIASFVYGSVITIFGLLYPVKAKGVTKIVPLFKNYYVAGVHAILMFYPFLFLNRALPLNLTSSLLLMLYIFVEAMIAQAILDTKDTIGDKKEKLKTLAVLFGNKFVYRLAALVTVGNLVFALTPLGSHFSFTVLLFMMFLLNLLIIYHANKGYRFSYLLAASKFSFWILIILLAIGK